MMFSRRQLLRHSACGFGAIAATAQAVGGAAIQATQVVGQALAIVGNNPTLQTAIKSLNQDCNFGRCSKRE